MLKTKEKIRRLDARFKKINTRVSRGAQGEAHVIVWGPGLQNKFFSFVFRGEGRCCNYGCPRETVERNLLCFNCLGEAKDKGNEKELIKAARIASLARKIKKKI